MEQIFTMEFGSISPSREGCSVAWKRRGNEYKYNARNDIEIIYISPDFSSTSPEPNNQYVPDENAKRYACQCPTPPATHCAYPGSPGGGKNPPFACC